MCPAEHSEMMLQVYEYVLSKAPDSIEVASDNGRLYELCVDTLDKRTKLYKWLVASDKIGVIEGKDRYFSQWHNPFKCVVCGTRTVLDKYRRKCPYGYCTDEHYKSVHPGCDICDNY